MVMITMVCSNLLSFFGIYACNLIFLILLNDEKLTFANYYSSNVLTVCNKLRAKDPFFFRQRGTEDIAQVNYHVKYAVFFIRQIFLIHNIYNMCLAPC